MPDSGLVPVDAEPEKKWVFQWVQDLALTFRGKKGEKTTDERLRINKRALNGLKIIKKMVSPELNDYVKKKYHEFQKSNYVPAVIHTQLPPWPDIKLWIEILETLAEKAMVSFAPSILAEMKQDKSDKDED